MNPAGNDPDIIISDPQIQNFINMINFTHKSVQFEGLVGIRKLISTVNNNLLIQNVVDSGIVPKLLEIMIWEDETQFQIASSWCVINICGGEAKFSDYILQLGGLDILINFFDSQIHEVVDNAIWAIANIAGTSSEFRDLCLQKDCMDKLLQALERFPTSFDIVDHSLHAISNLCSREPFPQWKKILPVLPVLHKHISEVHSQEALLLALQALSSISEQNMQEVIDQDFVPFLIDLLSEAEFSILILALKTLGNLVAEEDEQADEVMSFPDFLPKIFELTKRKESKIQREAFLIIRNITAGDSKQIEKILENKDYIAIVKAAMRLKDPIIAEDAVWTVCNMICGGQSDQIDCIVKKHGLLQSFTQILTDSAQDLKKEVLKAIQAVLKTREDFTNKIQKAGLVEIIRDLARGHDDLVLEADKILEYFPVIENSKETGNQREKRQKKKQKRNTGSGKSKKSI